MPKASVFENRKWVPLFAGSAALSWACAFPLIKLGLADFGIAGTDTGGKALFAGARFLLAGLVVLAVAKLCGRSFAVPRGKTRWQLVLFGLVNTALHYFFFYLGVSNSPGGRASILDSLGTFLLILAAAVVFREKLTLRSIFGCLLGFSGIVLINLGSTAGQFTLSALPVVNWICWIVWLCSPNTNKNKKNFIWANIIMWVISVVVLALFYSVVGTAALGALSSL